MSYYIKHTNAPWAVDKKLPMEETTFDLFQSSPKFIEEMLQQRYVVSMVSENYLQKFEVMLQTINLFFTSRLNNDNSEIAFDVWWNKQPGASDEISYLGKLFFCDIFLCKLSVYEDPPRSLVLKMVITRPCAEGLGFYKICIWQLILICRRMRFETLFISDCLPENFEMLRVYFGFDQTPDRFYRSNLKNCSLSLEKMDSMGDYLPWGLHKLIRSWGINSGIVLQNYESFAYPDQLNNEFYVNEKFRNIRRKTEDKVNLKHPFYGYPDESKRELINREFDSRTDSLQEAMKKIDPIPFILRNKGPMIYDTKEALPTPHSVSITPSTKYEGYPLSIKLKTRWFNETISDSQEEAARHIPMLQGGYYPTMNRKSREVIPDYTGPKEDYFGNESLTESMRNKALKHIPTEKTVIPDMNDGDVDEQVIKRSKNNEKLPS